jgi:hypothetical protein
VLALLVPVGPHVAPIVLAGAALAVIVGVAVCDAMSSPGAAKALADGLSGR